MYWISDLIETKLLAFQSSQEQDVWQIFRIMPSENAFNIICKKGEKAEYATSVAQPVSL